MSNSVLDNDPAVATHLPWESIGDAGDAVGEIESAQSVADEEQLPLTPWSEQITALGSSPMEIEPGAALQPDLLPEEVETEPEMEPELTVAPRAKPVALSDGGWTLVLLCAGIALIACCVLIPQTDANRRLAYERQKLQLELQNIEYQVKVNEEFLKRVADDPTLAQRLAERQMKVIPEGARVLELTQEPQGMSPFQLVSVAPPVSMPPYKPIGGTLANVCYGTHSRLYLIGISLGMIATGLVLGYAPQGR